MFVNGQFYITSVTYITVNTELGSWSSDQAIGRTVRDSNPGRGREIFLSSRTSRQSLGPPILLFNGYRSPFPEVKRPRREVNHTLLSSDEVRNERELYRCSPCILSWRGQGKLDTEFVQNESTSVFMPVPDGVRPPSPSPTRHCNTLKKKKKSCTARQNDLHEAASERIVKTACTPSQLCREI